MQQYVELVKKLAEADNDAALPSLRDAAINILAESAADRKSFADQIAAARADYADCSDNDIEIDDDEHVHLSPGGDPGVWVSAWVWVHIPEEDPEELDEPA